MCQRAACDAPGLLPHRDGLGFYCARCARKINELTGQAVFKFPSTRVRRQIVSSGREVVTWEYTSEPGVFHIVRRRGVSGPFSTDDRRFTDV